MVAKEMRFHSRNWIILSCEQSTKMWVASQGCFAIKLYFH